jgi:hypothetical protein
MFNRDGFRPGRSVIGRRLMVGLLLAAAVFAMVVPMVSAQTDTVSPATFTADELPGYDVNALLGIGIVLLVFVAPILITKVALRFGPTVIYAVRKALSAAS